MTNRQLDDEQIFHVARRISDRQVRSDYLQQICAGDQALRDRVEALLDVHEQEQSFLKSANDQVAATIDLAPSTEKARATFGRYKLMEQIGEGGMGVGLRRRAGAADSPQSRAEGHQAGHGLQGGRRPLRGRAAGAWR